MNNPFILAFGVFSASVKFLKEKRKCHIRVLSSFLWNNKVIHIPNTMPVIPVKKGTDDNH